VTREEIIRMAREAGFDAHDMSDDFTCNLKNIERFAALVAAAEREACAQTIERARLRLGLVPFVVNFLAAAIRKRGGE
jgi:hypothetical protein